MCAILSSHGAWPPTSHTIRRRLIEGATEEEEEMPSMGDISEVPYGEAMAWQGYVSPYYKESHIEYRVALRK